MAASQAQAALASSKGKSHSPQPVRPSQGPLKSTWHRQDDKHGWGFFHWLIHLIDIDPLPPASTTIVHDKDDPIPVWSNLSAHVFIWPRFGAAFALQYAYAHFTGHNFGLLTNMLFWGTYVALYGINVIHSTRTVAQRIGFLQPHKSRDGIPDHRVREVLQSLALTGFLRPVAATLLCYDPSPRHDSFSLAPGADSCLCHRRRLLVLLVPSRHARIRDPVAFSPHSSHGKVADNGVGTVRRLCPRVGRCAGDPAAGASDGAAGATHGIL
ncbi:hypothetical protein L1887_61868 [Cichorium endivia]|nr:hypothetical protein L1887_61868 [Cichorium endivia]